MCVNPGPIVLFGSGETAPGAQKIYHRVFSQMQAPIEVSILETPAGFEPNSDYVAGQVGRYLEHRLQNFQPKVSVIPARKRGTGFSPDDPGLAASAAAGDAIFMGPGSPTYAARQLRDAIVWDVTRAAHRQGAALLLASAATLAVSRYTIPIYEIYKVGEDLHWKPGLDLLGDFGLSIVFVPHWNNRDGGEALDTSRCYLGQPRFESLLQVLPSHQGDYTVVGIDEHTALMIDLVQGQCTVLGGGHVTVITTQGTQVHRSGSHFALNEMGAFRLPVAGEGIPAVAWEMAVEARRGGEGARPVADEPEEAVALLLVQREAARNQRDWAASDRLREEIATHGWRVLDTPEGQTIVR
ncbi:MAG: cysteinyl-tRNA synthetase [Anaerolineales bacterium]|nr:cysteinyl-tRNA synthetase [Anaerolineales bacterium]